MYEFQDQMECQNGDRRGTQRGMRPSRDTGERIDGCDPCFCIIHIPF